MILFPISLHFQCNASREKSDRAGKKYANMQNISRDILTYTLQQFLQNKRFKNFLAPKALQQLQSRSETSKRTLCKFSIDVPERPTALKVLKCKKLKTFRFFNCICNRTKSKTKSQKL